MAEANEDGLDEIRERRRRELEAKIAGEGTPETPTEPVHVDGRGELASVVAAHDVVLVDFYADWCGPCKMLEPTVESIAANTGGVVAKVDIDRNQSLAGEYGVRSVPTMLLFVDGEPAERLVGVRPEPELVELVEGHLGS